MSQQKEKVQHGGDWKQLLAAELWSLVYVCFIKHLFLFYFSSTCGWLPAGLVVWVLSAASATHRNTEHLAKQAFTLELNLITLGTWYSFDFLDFIQFDIQHMKVTRSPNLKKLRKTQASPRLGFRLSLQVCTQP